jgi:hypothetical protein
LAMASIFLLEGEKGEGGKKKCFARAQPPA